jgi:hypothetical protein
LLLEPGAAQHLAATDERVERLALMNSVLYDSWPVPAVKRFQDSEIADAVTVEELLQARAQSLSKAIARPLDGAERGRWLAPGTSRAESGPGWRWPPPPIHDSPSS